jgi:hypothetical protein
MKYILISFLILIQFGKTYSQDTGWTFATFGTNSDQKVYIKNEYVDKTDGYIKVWVKTVCKTVTIDNKVDKNITIKALKLFDCNGKRTKKIQVHVYDAVGKIIESKIYSGNEFIEHWEYVIPESVGEGELIAACQMFN